MDDGKRSYALDVVWRKPEAIVKMEGGSGREMVHRWSRLQVVGFMF